MPPRKREVEAAAAYVAADPLIAHAIAVFANANRSPRSCTAYAHDLEHFGAFLHDRDLLAEAREREAPPRIFPKLETATASDIRRFSLHLTSRRSYAFTSVRRKLSAIRTFYKLLKREGMRGDNPALEIELPKRPDSLPKALSEGDVRRLLETTVAGKDEMRARRDRAMIELLYSSGLRRAELVRLDLGDIDVERRVLRVTGKGEKTRLVLMTQSAADALRAYLAVRVAGRDDAVFLSRRGTRLSDRQLWEIFRDVVRVSGVSAHVTPHVMRHSFATHLIDHGADIVAVKELMGHASLSSTQVYLKTSLERLRDVFERAHPRDKDE